MWTLLVTIVGCCPLICHIIVYNILYNKIKIKQNHRIIKLMIRRQTCFFCFVLFCFLFPCYFVMLKNDKHELTATFYQCPSCVYFVSAIWQKGLWVQQSAKAQKEEGKGKEEATQTVLRGCRKQREERRQESQFSEDLQTLLISQLCLAAL